MNWSHLMKWSRLMNWSHLMKWSHLKKAGATTFWTVSSVVLVALLLAHSPSAVAGGSVPVVQSTGTPPACTAGCKRVAPDVIALLDPGRPGATAPPLKRTVIFLAKGALVITQVVEFAHELDIELTASGNQQTIHLPITVRPPSAALAFPAGVKLDSVIGLGAEARILYGLGTRGTFNRFSVSGAPFLTQHCSGPQCVRPIPFASGSRAL